MTKPATKRAVAKAPKTAAAPKRGHPPPVAQDKLNAVGIDAIAQQIIEGQTYRRIARQHGVSLGALAAWLERPEHSQACARAREMSAQAFDEKAESVIEDAEDPFQLAKARELAVHYRWRAKAVNPRRYGDKVAVGGDPDAPPVNLSHTVTFVAAQAAAPAQIVEEVTPLPRIEGGS